VPVNQNIFFSLLFILSGIWLALFSGETRAQTPKYSNEFLSIGVDARAMAMSNAFVSVANDATAGYWNPAGLLRLESDLQVALMHTEYFAGIAQYDYGAIAFNTGTKNAIGFSYLRFGVDDIPDTSELIDGEGNINYDRIRSFSASDNAFIFSFARLVNEQLRMGLNTKIIRRTAGSFASAWGFGLDLGAQYDYRNWKFALVGKDITSTFNAWSYDLDDSMREALTLTGNEIPENSLEITLPHFALGASYQYVWKDRVGMLASADLHITTDGKRNVLLKGDPISIDPSVGIELDYKKVVFIRAGAGNYQQYTHTNEQMKKSVQFNLGVGIAIGNAFELDYALTDVGDNSIALYSNVFSLKLNINRQNRETPEENQQQ